MCNKKLISLLAVLVVSGSMMMLQAQDIVLPDLLKGSVVLQQKTDARIWGKARPGAKITVRTPWNDASYTSLADKDSLWSVKVATPGASYTPYDITISSNKEKVTMKDVLIGDVWFCGGQSNMEMPLKGLMGCYVEGAANAILTSGNNKGLRYATVQRNKASEEQKGCFTKGIWYKSSAATVADVTACGYFFGEALSQALDYPIGLVSCSWSGSFLEDWMDKDLLKKYPDQKVFGAEFTKAYTNYYYGMLEPASKFTIKGMIWYQGESNVGSPDYAERLAAAVELWKSKFELKSMPFYIVELAPWLYSQGFENKCPYLREQQFKASKIIPDAGIVSTNDLALPWEKEVIHPARKKEVGQRLAMLALNKAYGFNLTAEGPVYKSMRIEEDGSAFLTFDNVPTGFMNNGEITGFEAAGDDKKFYPAKAQTLIKFNRDNLDSTGAPRGLIFGVKVTSEDVKNIVAVRYCFRDYLIGNLHNVEGFPAFPFRTDNWEE